MKIIICDDSLRDLSNIERLLQAYQEEHPTPHFDIEKYSDATQLSEAIMKNEPADIYILDMIMVPRSGIDLGRQLRSIGSESAIIYITASDDFAMEAYDVHAARYLLKPISRDKVFEAVHYAITYTKAKTDAVYLLKTRDGLVTIPYSKIEYIENVSRTLEVHLTSKEIFRSLFIRKSFDEEIRELMFDRRFAQVHKSFLVNLKYVHQLSKSRVTMESGTAIPVSQKRTAAVRSEYLSFVSEYYR